MGWGKYKTGKGSGETTFFSLREDGSSVKCVVMVEVSPRVAHLTRDNGEIIALDRPGHGDDCWSSYRIQVYDTDQKCPRILKATPGLWSQLVAFNDRRGLVDRVIEICRAGTGKDTKWLIDTVEMASDDLRVIIAAEDPMIEMLSRDKARPVPTDGDDGADIDPEPPTPDLTEAGTDDDIPF